MVLEKSKRKLELEAEIDSIRDRVRDIEWRIEFLGQDEDMDKLLDDRQKALDKMRHTRKELLELQKEMLR